MEIQTPKEKHKILSFVPIPLPDGGWLLISHRPDSGSSVATGTFYIRSGSQPVVINKYANFHNSDGLLRFGYDLASVHGFRDFKEKECVSSKVFLIDLIRKTNYTVAPIKEMVKEIYKLTKCSLMIMNKYKGEIKFMEFNEDILHFSISCDGNTVLAVSAKHFYIFDNPAI